ncbi:hypothetical protein CWI36_0195p0030 [Hamiltosporidium magnivora]|uniref:Uncharacterized protein n=1 Tax=Hamiltosporidium magnivora TaxID=148818 RepID=A0A4Q9LKY6_9MICR|nr:hypothetical protein CWI36_0195p0030 [Hamiltosporidium magnivora]
MKNNSLFLKDLVKKKKNIDAFSVKSHVEVLFNETYSGKEQQKAAKSENPYIKEDITDSKKYLGNKDTESEDEQVGCFRCCWSKKKKPSKTKNKYKELDQGSFQTYRRASSFDDIDYI